MKTNIIKCLVTAMVLFSFEAHAQSPLSKSAKQLEDLRMSLSPNLSSDEQYPKFSEANKALCASIQKNPKLKAKGSADQKIYLDQVLILTARLLKIDAGKLVMDCFAPYFETNEKIILSQLRSWKSQESTYLDSKPILEENLRLFKSRSDGKSGSEDEKELSLED